MEETIKTNATKLAWAVLMKGANGRSEVIKVTDHEDADQTILSNPHMFYKSGPFVLN